ncbi:class I lanthipeptide [Pontimicrobium sp. MEBiC01747]
MKTQNNKLVFNKHSVTELSDLETQSINGGCQWGDSSGVTVTIKISIVDNPPPTDTIIVQF